jgi:hypothetical protein
MNEKKLKRAEALFLQKYPEGFANPEMQALGKKHRVDKMVELSQELFTERKFNDIQEVAESMIKVVSRASMVSMFEKPKFRDYLRSLSTTELQPLTNGLKTFLHGSQQKGFEAMVKALRPAKLAKWSLITIIPNYYFPNDEVFVKPTTAKGVIKHFELEDLEYKPLPSWEFYQKYREEIKTMKAQVIDTLAPNNAAFCGFLMMSLDK